MELVDVVDEEGRVLEVVSKQDALVRETQEELGFTEKFKYELVGKARFDRHVIGRHENHLFAYYKIYSDTVPVLNHESQSCRYFTEAELRHELHDHPEHFGPPFHFLVQTFWGHLLPPRVRTMRGQAPR